MMRLLGKVLPTGTVQVGLGMAVLAVAAYVQLAVAGHSLAEPRMASMSVMWAIVFSVAPGIFFPLEQELTRLVAQRRQTGEPLGPVLRKGLAIALAMAALITALCAAFQQPLAQRLFDGDTDLVWLMCGSLAVHALAHFSRGIMAGLGEFRWYGTQIAVDGATRLVVALAVIGAASVQLHAMSLVLGPALSVLVTVAPLLRANTAGPALAWGALTRHLGLLIAAVGLSQMMINISVISVQVIAPDEDALAVGLLSALILIRVPVFLFGAMHAALLSGATTAAETHDWQVFRRLVGRALAVVGALTALAAVVAVAVGPPLIGLVFNAPPVLGRTDFLLLSLAVCAYLFSLVLGQAAIALRRHRAQALAWVTGTAVLIAVTTLPIDLTLRVELAFIAGATATATLLASTLRRAVPAAPAVTAQPSEATT